MSESIGTMRGPSRHRLKLGIFMPNTAGGVSISFAPTSTRPTFEYNRRVAQLADRLGFDFLLPVGRWKGFGGAVDAEGESLEVLTWATAIATSTRRIFVWSTVHVPLIHPVLAAKMAATIQHVSGGRFGLNVVTGWNQVEIAMFGITNRPPEQRHEQSAEWIEVVTRLWTEQDFDFLGRHYQVLGGYLKPKPEPLPLLMNAGTSEASKEMSARHMDYFFINPDRLESIPPLVADVTARAAAHGRELRPVALGFVLARDTERGARRALDRILREADLVCLDNYVRVANIAMHHNSEWEREELERRMIAGAAAPLVVGTPAQVADQLAEYAATGVDGMMLCWHDYQRELGYFGREVLPLLEQRGLREPRDR